MLAAFLLEPGVLSDLRERDSPASELPGILHVPLAEDQIPNQ